MSFPHKKVRDIDKALLNGAYFGNSDQVIKCLKNGADPSYMEERDGWLPLHYASRWGDTKMLYALLKYNADINGRTLNKETALHKAARWDRWQVAIILLRRNCDIHPKNTEGMKASDMTQDANFKYMIENFSEWSEEQLRKKQLKESENSKQYAGYSGGFSLSTPRSSRSKSPGRSYS